MENKTVVIVMNFANISYKNYITITCSEVLPSYLIFFDRPMRKDEWCQVDIILGVLLSTFIEAKIKFLFQIEMDKFTTNH